MAPPTNRIRQIADETDTERDAYINQFGWTDNPFSGRATIAEYVIPSKGTVADIASAIQDYTGPVLIHSRFSGVGKTTLLQMLLDSLDDQYDPVEIGEHNMSAYELAAILADDLGVGKSSSTKLTEAKVRRALTEADRPALIGVDEFGLNSKDTLHTIQYVNDLPNTRILLTGMTSQWEAVGSLGSDGRAFQRRVAYETQLGPFTQEQTVEMVKRRIATSSEDDPGPEEWEEVSLGPITDDALATIHENASGVPAVITAALAELVGLAAYRYDQTGEEEITTDLAESISYANPEADFDPDDEDDDETEIVRSSGFWDTALTTTDPDDRGQSDTTTDAN